MLLMRSLRKSHLTHFLAGAVLAAGLLAAGLDAVDAGGRTDGRAVTHHQGWDRLPLPPEVRDGNSYLATDDQILVFGGCGERPKYDCRPTRDGFSYSPTADRWSRMPKAPFGPI